VPTLHTINETGNTVLAVRAGVDEVAELAALDRLHASYLTARAGVDAAVTSGDPALVHGALRSLTVARFAMQLAARSCYPDHRADAASRIATGMRAAFGTDSALEYFTGSEYRR
jgi:hypothetical protein